MRNLRCINIQVYYFMNLNRLDRLPSNSRFKKDDLFVLVGELFSRGYANGLVDEAKRCGMRVVGLTVGRRDKGVLRALNAEELALAEANIGCKIINVPLEAGFDMEEPANGENLLDRLNNAKFQDWETISYSDAELDEAMNKGRKRFDIAINKVMQEIENSYSLGKNIFFAHIMAGGVPRSKLILLIANRVFKGRGERYLSSASFWNSGIGKFVSKNFNEVTANTFEKLIKASTKLREKAEKSGGYVCYSAYGYHGCEILYGGSYKWQTYTPYQQGHAKKLLEQHARNFQSQGVNAAVINCPEIRTNSSDIFVGVELSLYPFMKTMQLKDQAGGLSKHIMKECQRRLNDGSDLDTILADLEKYLLDPLMKKYQDFQNWPLENTVELAELMVGTSELIVSLHKTRKELISDYLSSYIIKGTGALIFNYMSEPTYANIWLGHEIIADKLNSMHINKELSLE